MHKKFIQFVATLLFFTINIHLNLIILNAWFIDFYVRFDNLQISCAICKFNRFGFNSAWIGTTYMCNELQMFMHIEIPIMLNNMTT
jgi:hypothetical protein